MTTIVVCADSPTFGKDLALPGREIILANELCMDPGQLALLVPDKATTLVMAVHRSHANLGSLQAAVRKLGFDPLGVGIVDIETVLPTRQPGLALEAAVARGSLFPGSVPEQVKLLPPDRGTRRGFLSLGNPIYTGAPLIREASCVAANGCKACVTQCPAAALTWSAGTIHYDVNSCVACGICVTTCPTGAIRNPSVDPKGVQAEVAAAVALSEEPIGIRYRCRDSVVPGEAGWYQVEVPCTGMLTVGWLLAPLFLGAVEVDPVPCRAGGCRLANDSRLEATSRDAARARSSFSTTGYIASPQVAPDEVEWWAHGATGRALAAMAPDDAPVSVRLEVADVGLVHIEPNACTACGMCAAICPTGALSSTVDETGVRIEFDPRVCVACRLCVGTCPEAANGAIELLHGFDGVEWALGRREIRHEHTPTCELCGQPVAPASMLSRIEEMLGDDASTVMSLVGRRCVNCRGR